MKREKDKAREKERERERENMREILICLIYLLDDEGLEGATSRDGRGEGGVFDEDAITLDPLRSRCRREVPAPELRRDLWDFTSRYWEEGEELTSMDEAVSSSAVIDMEASESSSSVTPLLASFSEWSVADVEVGSSSF